MDLITLDDVRRAADHLQGVALRTPVIAAPWAGDLWLKPENLQPIGSFKIRGAYHAVASLAPADRARGVTGTSSGNHGQGLAFAARAFGIPCVIVCPDSTPEVKLDAMRALGAEVIVVPPERRWTAGDEIATERQLPVIPPFDSPEVIAGQGTVGLEIVEDLAEVDTVLVPIGGGGLSSGVATAVKSLNPGVKVIGVEPELAADAQESIRAGKLITWPQELTYRTSADGVRGNLSPLTFAHLAANLDDVVTVSEAEITDAVRALAQRSHLVAEPSGALTTAAYLRSATDLGRTVAVISGGNIDPSQLSGILSR